MTFDNMTEHQTGSAPRASHADAEKNLSLHIRNKNLLVIRRGKIAPTFDELNRLDQNIKLAAREWAHSRG